RRAGDADRRGAADDRRRQLVTRRPLDRLLVCRDAERRCAQLNVSPPCGRAELWLVDADRGASRKLSDDAIDPAWSPDGRRLSFVDYVSATGAKVEVADLTLGRIRMVGSTGLFPQVSWAPDGRRLAYTAGSGDASATIVVASTEGAVERTLPVAPHAGVGDLTW